MTIGVISGMLACEYSITPTRLYTVEWVQSDSLSEYRDTIVGRFNGKDTDTLICEPAGAPVHDNLFGDLYFEWHVFTTNGTIEEFTVGNTIGMRLINEGDLDRNGTDEWGFISIWPTSSWTVYNIFTAQNGEWKRLLEPIRIWRGHFEDMFPTEDIAQSSDIKNHIRIKYSEVVDDMTNWIVIDTIIPVSIKDYSYDLVKW